MNPSRILIVEDDAVLATHLAEMLKQMGYQVTGLVATGKQAIQSVLELSPDLVLMDIRLRGKMTGIQAAEEIHKSIHVPIVYLTAYTDETLLQQAKLTEAYAYLAKPVREHDLRASLEMALYKHESEKHIQHLNQVLRAVREVNQLINRERNPQRLLDEACNILMRARGYQFVWVGLPENNRLRLVSSAGDDKGFVNIIFATASMEQAKKLPGSECSRSQRAAMCQDILHDERYSFWQQEARNANLLSTIATPMLSGDRFSGVLNVYGNQSNLFGDDEIGLLSELANDLAFALNFIEEEFERKRANDAALESGRQLKALVDSLDDIVFEIDDQGTFLNIWAADESLLMRPKEQVLGRHIEEVLGKEIGRPFTDAVKRVLANGHSEIIEYPLEVMSGLRWFMARISPIFNPTSSCKTLSMVIRDITERRNADEVLRESEERYRNLVEMSPDGIAVHQNGVIVFTNTAGATALGAKDPAELIGKSAIEIIHPENRSLAVQRIQKLMKGEKLKYPIEDRYLRLDGTEMPVDIAATAIVYQGKPAIQVIARDNTQRKQAEEALHESEERYRLLVEMAPIAIGVHVEGKINFVNQAGIRMLGGSSLEDFVNKSVFDFVHPAWIARVQERMRLAIQENRAAPLAEIPFIRLDGKAITAEISGVPITYRGKPAYMNTIIDITERKQAEIALRRNEEKYRGLMESMDSVIAIVNYEGCFLYMNDAAAAQLGRTENELIGKSMHELFPELVATRQMESIRKAILEDRKIAHENVSYIQGKPHWYNTTIQPIHDEQGQVINALVNSVDINDLKTTQQELMELNLTLEERVKQRTAEVRDLYDNAPAGYHSLDKNGVIIMINQTELGWLGCTNEEIIGVKKFRDLLTPQSQRSFDVNFPLFMEQGWITGIEYEVVCKDGNILTVLLNATAVYDADGNFIQSRATMIDITERKQAEETTRKLSQAVEHSPTSVIITDRSGAIEYVNPIFCKVTGYRREDVLGKNPRIFKSGQHPKEFYQAMWATLTAGQAWHGEICNKRKNGELFWEYASISPVRNERGETTHYVAVKEDVTERKKAADALRASEERLNFMLAKTPAGIFTARMTAGTPITFISDSVRDILGYEPRQFLEDPGFWISRIHPDDLGEKLEEVTQSLLAQGHAVWESRIKRADGEYHWMSAGASLMRDHDGAPLEMIGYMVDVDEKRQAQEALQISETQLRESRDELRVANAALEKAARAKDEFLASMSHELRSPLTGILGLSEALQYKTYGELTLKQENALKNIENSGRHLLALINDILDLSKIEAGQLSLQVEAFSLAEICQASLQLIKGLAHQKKQNVSFSINPPEILISADPRRLKQILVNLLSNAVKFTAAGGSLGLIVAGSATEHTVSLTVWDKGIGIKPEDLPRLFQPFVQLDSSLSRQSAGTGLGLSLVLRMAELHGGSVQVESVPAEGSRFTIVLPWLEPTLPAIQPILPGTGRLGRTLTVGENDISPVVGPLILIVDDNELTVQPTADMLTLSGFRVVISQSGLDGLHLVPKIQPDLILMDIQMPDMDGFEATRQLRAHADPRISSIPIIAVTALAMTGDRERCLAAGANDYLSKPVQLKKLVARISELLAN